VKFFGAHPPKQVLGCTQIETPIGEWCAHCGEAILLGDSGVMVLDPDVAPEYLHGECLVREIVGSPDHLRGCGRFYGGIDGDPLDLTPRQAARESALLFILRSQERDCIMARVHAASIN
jgi:hypothetical protein